LQNILLSTESATKTVSQPQDGPIHGPEVINYDNDSTVTPSIAAASEATGILKEFFDVLEENTLVNADGQRYIRHGNLTRWLRRTSLTGGSHVGLLLDQVYPEAEMVPIPAHTLSEGPRCCLLIFSILLELSAGHLINMLVTHDFADQGLPYEESRLARLDCSDVLKKSFYEVQWAYCAVTFSLDMSRELANSAVLPIHQRRLISSGGTAQVSEIAVLEEFVVENLRQRCSYAKFQIVNIGTVSV
jgi:hypothetical protein